MRTEVESARIHLKTGRDESLRWSGRAHGLIYHVYWQQSNSHSPALFQDPSKLLFLGSNDSTFQQKYGVMADSTHHYLLKTSRWTFIMARSQCLTYLLCNIQTQEFFCNLAQQMERFLNHLDLPLVSIAKGPWKVPVKGRQNLMGRTLCMPHPSGPSRFITASLAKG